MLHNVESVPPMLHSPRQLVVCSPRFTETESGLVICGADLTAAADGCWHWCLEVFMRPTIHHAVDRCRPGQPWPQPGPAGYNVWTSLSCWPELLFISAIASTSSLCDRQQTSFVVDIANCTTTNCVSSTVRYREKPRQRSVQELRHRLDVDR